MTERWSPATTTQRWSPATNARWNPTDTSEHWNLPVPVTTTTGGPFTAMLGTPASRLGNIELGSLGVTTTTAPRERWAAADTTTRWD